MIYSHMNEKPTLIFHTVERFRLILHPIVLAIVQVLIYWITACFLVDYVPIRFIVTVQTCFLVGCAISVKVN